MQVVRVETLIGRGEFATSQEAASIVSDIRTGIAEVVWPPGASTFTLSDRKKGNGVKPIKDTFVSHLVERGWQAEQRLRIAARLKPGPVDVVRTLSSGKHFAVEWETGNISSTHRALNKLAVGMLSGVLSGGALILPTRRMYYYLTDRVGNVEEIEPYFAVWKSWPHIDGLLLVFAVEHDAVSDDVRPIPKGTDGRALV